MKSKSMFITGACLAALAFCAAPMASAKDKKNSTTEATASASPSESAAPAKRAVPYHGKIASVDSSAKTFTITTKAGEDRVYKMTDATTYKKDGQPATMADVAADQEVRGQYMKMDDGAMEVKSVMLGMKPKKEGGSHGKHKKSGDASEASPAPSATP